MFDIINLFTLVGSVIAHLSFVWTLTYFLYSKTCLKRPLKKKTKIGFQDRLSLNEGQKYCRMLPFAGQKYCRMLQGEHSAILLTFIKLPFDIKTFVLSIFEWPLKTGFTLPLFDLILYVPSTIFQLFRDGPSWVEPVLS